MGKTKMRVPTKQEQDEMNRIFDSAPNAEKSRVSYVQIELGELGAYRAEIPSSMARKFASDIIDGFLNHGTKPKETPGGTLARNILSRAFFRLQESIRTGADGAAARWNQDNATSEK